jgi:glycosyltransferase involved in cell wall biosynthesis
MIGDGPERAACEKLASKLRIADHVHFLGQRSDVAALMGQVTLLCITSHNEGFSLVAAEAAAARLPVVAYSVGGLPEVVIHGETGMLVPDGDEAKFVDAVVEVLSNDELRRSLAGQAGAHAEVFDLNQHIASLIKVYGELATGSKADLPDWRPIAP